MKNKKTMLITVVTVSVAVLVVLAIIIGSFVGCEDNTATADEVVETQVQIVTEVVTDAQGNTHIEEATEIVEIKTDKKSDDKSEKSKDDDKKDNSSSKSDSSSSSKTNNSSNSSSSSKNNSSSSNKNTSSSKNDTSSSNKNTSSNNNSSSTSKNEEPKHSHSWVNMTKQVKIIDQKAYTYEEPVYEKQGRAICNDCGADITDNLYHIFDEADNGGKGSYRVETINVQVGTKTVEVPEKSHYETEVIGRKCNSCGEKEYY